MRILARWNEKVTYFLLIFTIFVCFCVSLALLGFSLFVYADFLEDAAHCGMQNSFQCLLNAVVDKKVVINEMRVVTALNLSIVALWLSSIVTIIYKLYKIKRSEK